VNPQGSSLGRFRDGCHQATLACLPFKKKKKTIKKMHQAEAGSNLQSSLNRSRLTIGHRKKSGPGGM